MIPLHVIAFATLTAQPPQGEPAARPDASCVALVLPSAEGVDDAMAVAASVRSIFQSYLAGPSLKSVLLEARLPSQAAEEARQKDCTRILTVTVTRKTNGGGGSKLGAVASAAGSTAGYIPMPNYGTAAAVGAAHAGAQAVASLAGSTQAKDEMRLTYKVTSADGATLLAPKTETAKARSNGEDLLSPMIARASEAVAAVVTKK